MSIEEETTDPCAPTFTGGVAVFTGGAGAALTSHLLFLFFGSSATKTQLKGNKQQVQSHQQNK